MPIAPIPRQASEPLGSNMSPWPFVIVAIDYFTKVVKTEALVTIMEKNIANFIWRNIVCRFGIPNTIITDNGRQFDNGTFRKFYVDLNFEH